jgi:pectate lyase
VYVVTTTASTGPGSLLYALTRTHPRIIVFRVSGVIDLKENGSWSFSKNMSYVTVAGQTSPGGITLVSSNVSSTSSIFWCYSVCRDNGNFHDAVFRFLRFRGTESNWDGVTLTYSHDFIFDHCDFSGGDDETLDICYDYNFTIQWCTMANSCGSCYGTLLKGDNSYGMTFHHNLWAHHKNRGGPYVYFVGTPPNDGTIDYRNNVCHNIDTYAFYTGGENVASGSAHVNVVGNTIKAGPISPETDWTLRLISLPGVTAYDQDNRFIDKSGTVYENVLDSLGRYDASVSTKWDMPAVTTTSSAQAYEDVLNKAGALPHDAMTKRTMNDVRNGTGQVCNISEPLITSGPEPPADTDMDGMPDTWEAGMGLNPNDPADNSGDHDGDGYTNIEEYINDLALILCGDEPHNTDVQISAGQGKFYNPLSIYPNPFTGNGKISLQIAGVGKNDGKIQISDIRGRLVSSFPAASRLAWNGCGKNGDALAPGLYMVRLTIGGRMLAKRSLVVVR